MMLAGWGRYPRYQTEFLEAREPDELLTFLRGRDAVIARGAGRAYGDAAIGVGVTLGVNALNRMISFDRMSCELRVEAGVTLAEIIHAFLPRGFFPPVVPGTQHVTVAGMVAANVHGKNHHCAGAFGSYVERLTLVPAEGSEIVCSRQEHPDLFFATLGGMGLTGVIRDVTFRMMPVETGFVCCETLALPHFDAAIQAFEQSGAWTYVVAWIDALARGSALGRSVLFRGVHARHDDLEAAHVNGARIERRKWRATVPIDLPVSILSRPAVRLFNHLYYRRGGRGAEPRLMPLASYFFPLDAIGEWNRLYGRQGFLQHQSVFPKSVSRDAVGAILDCVSAMGSPSFLAVLKLMGQGDRSLMGFPMEGYTLALDFPATKENLELIEVLDGIVVGHGGRLYLAKDASQKRETVEAGYPGIEAFRELRQASGAAAKFRSRQSERLGL